MPKGVYKRTEKMLENYAKGRKKMWQRRTPQQRSVIMNKLAILKYYNMSPEERKATMQKLTDGKKNKLSTQKLDKK